MGCNACARVNGSAYFDVTIAEVANVEVFHYATSVEEAKGAVAASTSMPVSTSGFATFRYIMRALGMPNSFQPLTDGILISNSLATSAVSPSASMILVASVFITIIIRSC